MQHQKQAQAEDDKADTMDSLNTIPHYVIANTTREKENVLDQVTTNRADVVTKVLSLLVWDTSSDAIVIHDSKYKGRYCGL